MALPSFTKMMFAVLIGTLGVVLLFSIFLQFQAQPGNNLILGEPYQSALVNISSQYSRAEDLGYASSDQGLVTNVFNAGKNIITGTVNVFVVGLSALGSFFNLIPIVGVILTAINSATGGVFSPLIGLATVAFAIYLGMRYIQTASNKYQEP